MDKVSYALGLGIGQQLKSMGAQDLCIDDFAQAIKDVLENKELAVSHHEAQSIVTQYFQEKEAAMNKEKEAKGKQAKALRILGNAASMNVIWHNIRIIKMLVTRVICWKRLTTRKRTPKPVP